MDEVRAAREASAAKDRIHLLGAVKDASKLLEGFDLFVLASIKEGMPWAILEAAAAGIPIIATRVGAIPEMLAHGETGYLIPPGDEKALAEAMARLMTDKELYEKLRAGAPRAAAARSARGMIEKTLDLYGRLLAV